MKVPKLLKPEKDLDEETKRLMEGYKKIDEDKGAPKQTGTVPLKVCLLAEKSRSIYAITFKNTLEKGVAVSPTFIRFEQLPPKKFSNFEDLAKKIAKYHRRGYVNPISDLPGENISTEIMVPYPPLTMSEIEIAVRDFYKKEFENAEISAIYQY